MKAKITKYCIYDLKAKVFLEDVDYCGQSKYGRVSMCDFTNDIRLALLQDKRKHIVMQLKDFYERENNYIFPKGIDINNLTNEKSYGNHRLEYVPVCRMEYTITITAEKITFEE